MKVTVAVLADYTNVSQEGKLNILGIFDEVRAPVTPARHPELKLVLRLEVELVELGREHSIEVQCMDEDGGKILEVKGGFTVRKAEGSTARANRVNHVLGFRDLMFPHFGTFTFGVFIDGHNEANVDLQVVKIDVEQPLLPGV